MSRVGIVLIGRNEGQRLVRALEAALRDCSQLVYVDSGSSDDSVEQARSRGVQVVELDTTVPFTAARAQNAGLERLAGAFPEAQYVQFIDGDCVIEEGWIDKATAALDADPSLAVVFGRRREERPEASLYHRIIDMEWAIKPGPVQSCGGDVMMRIDLLREAGGYNPTVAAGEEPELCMRLRDKGGSLLCLAEPMTIHDAQIHRLRQYLRRDIRTGRGATDVHLRFPRPDNPFTFVYKKILQWGWVVMGLSLVAVVLIAVPLTRPLGLVLLGLCLAAQALRTIKQVLWSRRRGLSMHDALCFGLLVPLSTAAQVYGQAMYFIDRARKRETRLIEYKETNSDSAAERHAKAG